MTGRPPDSLAADGGSVVPGLQDATRAFLSSVDGAAEAWRTGVRSGVLAVAVAHCRDMADRHARLAEELGTAGDDPPATWNAIRGYVGSTAGDVCAAVPDTLGATTVIPVLYQRSDDAFARLESAADLLPENARIPVPAALYAPHPSDGPGVRLQKTTVRAGHRVRRALTGLGNVFRRVPREAQAPERTLDLRRHAHELVRGPLREAFLSAERSLREDVARTLLTLQRSIDAWARKVLPAFDDADDPAWHVSTRAFPGRPAAEAASQPAREEIEGAAAALTAALRSAAAELEAVVIALEPSELAHAAMARALEAGGTGLHRPAAVLPDARIAPRVLPEGAADRSRLAAALAAFRVNLAGSEDAFHHAATAGILVPLARANQVIADLVDDLARDALRAIERGAAADLLSARDAAVAQLELRVRELPQPDRSDEAVRSAAASVRADLESRIREMPLELRVPVGAGRRLRLVALPLRETARHAFERDLGPRVFDAYAPLRRELVRVWNDAEQLVSVVDTAFSTAAEELDGPGDASDRLQSARALLSDGMRRARELLEDGYGSLRRPWTGMASAVHGILVDDWSLLRQSAYEEDALAKQWQSVRTRLERRGERILRFSAAAWRRASRLAVAGFRIARMRISRAVHLGRAAVGAAEVEVEEQIRTLDAMSGAQDLFKGLPLIYRKLFTMQALVEPTLAVNRQEDLAAVRAAFDRWMTGIGPGLFVVSAEPGSGRTSFLNLAGRSLAASARVVQIPLADRLNDEASLVAVLARGLGMDPGMPGTLSGLEHAIHAASPERSVVLVDDLEHLMLQTSGGTALLESLLLFFARTDGSLFWCASIGTLAWRVLERTLPAATGLAITRRLRPWDREAVQDLVLKRHQRTGMPLEFERPDNPPPLLRQRLRRARTEDQVQRLLRDEFFDGLFRSSGQDPALALYGWIRTGRFDEKEDKLCLPSFRPLSFAFLDDLDTDRAFVLRAFLVHYTLSPGELARLFRFSADQATANLETLLALGLIEPIASEAPGSYVVAGTRYRLRRLVLQPVRRFLTERHFVY